MSKRSCVSKNIFLKKLKLTNSGHCVPIDEKASWKMCDLKCTRQLLDEKCSIKCAHVVNLWLECSSPLCPVVVLKDISVQSCLSQNGTVQLTCMTRSLPDKMFTTPPSVLEMSSKSTPTLCCKCNVIPAECKELKSENDSWPAAVHCNRQQEIGDRNPNRMTKNTMFAFDLTSQLGRLKFLNGHYLCHQCKVSCICYKRLAYDRFCKHLSPTRGASSLQKESGKYSSDGRGNFPVVYQQNRKLPDCDVHEYHFSKRQRNEFCKRIDWSLNAQSRKLKSKMRKCVVVIPMLFQKSLACCQVCRVHLSRVSQQTLSAQRAEKVTHSKRLKDRYTSMKNCTVHLDRLPLHVIRKFSSSSMSSMMRSLYSTPSNIKSCSVSLRELPQHKIH